MCRKPSPEVPYRRTVHVVEVPAGTARLLPRAMVARTSAGSVFPFFVVPLFGVTCDARRQRGLSTTLPLRCGIWRCQALCSGGDVIASRSSDRPLSARGDDGGILWLGACRASKTVPTTPIIRFDRRAIGRDASICGSSPITRERIGLGRVRHIVREHDSSRLSNLMHRLGACMSPSRQSAPQTQTPEGSRQHDDLIARGNLRATLADQVDFE